jgi:hypothetical protein
MYLLVFCTLLMMTLVSVEEPGIELAHMMRSPPSFKLPSTELVSMQVLVIYSWVERINERSCNTFKPPSQPRA